MDKDPKYDFSKLSVSELMEIKNDAKEKFPGGFLVRKDRLDPIDFLARVDAELKRRGQEQFYSLMESLLIKEKKG